MKIQIVAAVACLLAPVAAFGQKSDCHPDASGDPATSLAEDVGLDSGVLASAITELRGNERDIHALVILRRCRVVAEVYARGVTRSHNHALYSVTKSVVATLAGILLNSGRLRSLDTTVAEAMGASASLDAERLEKARRISLRQAMSMTSGLEYKNRPADHPIYRSSDRFQVGLSPPFVHTPGRQFNYSDGDASIAGAVVAAVAGVDLSTFANASLFGPLQFQNVEWWFRDKAGRYPGGWGLRLRTVDMAKLGQLYLQRGRWHLAQIVDSSFVDTVWSAGTAAHHYGLFWWRWEREIAAAGPIYYANGFKGQRVFAIPRHAIVVAINANISDVDIKSAYPALLRTVVSAVRDEGKIGRSATAEKLLAEEVAKPFKGKPGMLVSEQDTPRLAKN